MTPELSRTLALDVIGSAPKILRIEASPEERLALARRFALASLDRLVADVSCHQDGADIFATGTMEADVVQSCVATGQPVPAAVRETFRLRFVAPAATPDADEIEILVDDCDTMEHDGRVIDLGEAVSQTLALALDPFPRSPDADTHLRAAGVLEEHETGPFAALKGLLGKS